MITVENLGFAYQQGQWILRNLSFHLEKGKVLGILGPNGRGKSTLLKLLMGLLKPQEGRCVLEDAVGYVPQRCSGTLPYDTLDMVVMGRARHLGLFSTPTVRDYQIARDAMEVMEIGHLQRQRFSNLSGGQQQMALIARALASGSRCLILDEPASALDFKNQQKVLKTIRLLAEEQRIASLFTTHFPQHIIRAADQALLIYTPEKILWGEVDQVMTDKTLSELYEMDVRRLTFENRGKREQTIVPVF